MTSPTPVVAVESICVQPRSTESKLHLVVLDGILGALIFGVLAFGAVEWWSIFVLQAMSVLLFILWVIRQVIDGEVHIHWNPLFLPGVAFVALALAQLTVGHTAYRDATISALLPYGCYGLIGFLLVQCLRHRRQAERLTWGLSILGVMVAGFAVVQDLTANGKLYWLRAPVNGGWIYGPYVNHNHFAGLMEMLAPIPLAVYFSQTSNGRKVFAVAASAFMTSTIFLCGSRGGMMAVAAQFTVAAIFLATRGIHRKSLAGLGVLLALTAVLLVWLGGPELLRRMKSVHHETHAELTGGARVTIDRDTIRMFAKNPLQGWGLGTFSSVYPQFRSFYTNDLIDHAHNDYLELLAETGTIGFAIAAWFLGATLRGALRRIGGGLGDTNSLTALASLVGIVGVLVHSLVDFNLHIPANALLFYLLCCVATLDHRSATRHKHLKRTAWSKSAFS